MTKDMNKSFPTEVTRLVKEAAKHFSDLQGKGMEYFAKKLELKTTREIAKWKAGRTPKDYEGILALMETALAELRNGNTLPHISHNGSDSDLRRDVQELKIAVHELVTIVKGSPKAAVHYGKEIYILNKVKIVEEDK